MPGQRLTTVLLPLTIALVLFSATSASAQVIGADPAACQGDLSVCTHHMSTYSFVSLTEGNAAETYSAARVMSAFGPTLDFDLIYNSYNADGNRAAVDNGIGYGWTHTYNDFLFTQGNDLFRWGPDGRVTKFTYTGGSYQAAPGYFETLTVNEDGTITITTKYQTKFRYQGVLGIRHHATGLPANSSTYQLISVTDRNNNVVTLNYSSGSLVSVTDTYGRSLTFTYSNFHLASVTDPLGRVTTFAYDHITGHQLAAITDPLGHSTTYTYDGQNQLTMKVDRDGRRFIVTYGDFELPTSEADGNNGIVYQLQNGSNWATDQSQLNQNALRVYIPSTTLETDGRGNVWQYAYDSNGFPLTITAAGATTTYVYDPATLRVASMIDANGHTSSFLYDAKGNLIKSTDANNNDSQFTYEPNFNQMTSMTDPNGRTTSYAYDGSGNRITETDTLEHTATMTYDAHGNVLTSTDKRGNTTTYVYDSFGNRTRATDSLGEVTRYVYDAVGNMTSVTDPNGHTTTYQYDVLNRPILQTDTLGGTVQAVYDAEGDATKVTDQDGNATRNAYDLRRRPVVTTDPLGKTTLYSYDGNNNRVSLTDRNGHNTTYAYDAQNHLTSTTDALGNVSSSRYDGVGNKLADVDANGHTTTYSYDPLNRRTQTNDSLGEITTYAYDLTNLPGCSECTGPTLGSSKVTQQTDANGKVLFWAYDGLDRVIVELHKQGTTDYAIEPNDAVIRYTYDENSNPLSATDPVADTTVYSYDAANRQTQRVNAAGDTWLMTYDMKGNLKTSTEPNLNLTTNTYDALDRLIQVDDEVGRVANYTYDAVGNVLTSKDGNGHGTTSVYDADYRLTSATDALGSKTSFTYDAEANPLTTTDRMGSVTTSTYDSVNRLIRKTMASGNTITYDYDAVGNLRHIADPGGHTTTYDYDDVNRVFRERYADTSFVYYTYDGTGHLIERDDQNGRSTHYTYSDLYYLLQRNYALDASDNFTYDLAGRMLTAEKGGWIDTFQWDQRNFMTQTTQNGELVRYIYGIDQRQRGVYYPENATSILETTDARGRLGGIEDITNFETNVGGYSYDLANNVLSRNLANGVTATIAANANNWATSLLTQNLNQGLKQDFSNNRIADFSYSYDRVGTRVAERKLSDSSPGQNQTASFNSIYQMQGFKSMIVAASTVPKPLVPQATQTQITFDAVGNWSTKVTDGQTENRTHNSMNEITSINGTPLAYDANGNLLQDPQHAYSYNQDDQITNVTTNGLRPAALVQIRYDALGRRVEKIGMAATRRYFYDGMRLIEEQDVVQHPTATYIYGNALDELLVAKELGSGAVWYYQQDALGSVTVITNSVGTPLERYRYDSFGQPTVTDGNGVPIPPNASGTPHSAIGNPWMFNNRYLDEETGLFDYRSRSFHPGLGRFLQVDSVGNWGDESNMGNAYAYVANNPGSHSDPLGLGANDPIDGVGVGLGDKKSAWCRQHPASCCADIAPTGKLLDAATPKLSLYSDGGLPTSAGLGAGGASWTNASGGVQIASDSVLGVVDEPIGGVGVGLGKKPEPSSAAYYNTSKSNVRNNASVAYTKQKPDGTAAGNVAAKWNVAQGAAALTIGPGSGSGSGSTGTDNWGVLVGAYTKQKPDGTAAGNVAAKWNVAQGAAAITIGPGSGSGSGSTGMDNWGVLVGAYTKQKPDGTAAGNVAAKWNVAQGAAAITVAPGSGSGTIGQDTWGCLVGSCRANTQIIITPPPGSYRAVSTKGVSGI